MIGTPNFPARIETALEGARDRVAAALARDVPPDVAVTVVDGGVVLRGAALRARSLVDPRLRDFAGLLR